MTNKFTDLSRITEHPAYCLGDKIAEICAPLFNSFAINYFSYSRIYIERDGTKLLINACCNKSWLQYYYCKKYKLLNTGKPFNFWMVVMEPRALKDAGVIFSHHNGIIFDKIFPDCFESLEFASPTSNTCPLEFCNNKALLNQFLIYFKCKAANVLKILEKEPLYLSQKRFPKIELIDQAYNDFCQAIKIKKVPLRFKSKEIIFTRREFDVLSLMTKGKSMCEVGNILQISPRTVENYVYNAKEKSLAFTVNQLLEYFSASLF